MPLELCVKIRSHVFVSKYIYIYIDRYITSGAILRYKFSSKLLECVSKGTAEAPPAWVDKIGVSTGEKK